ncbi:TrkH family potassium uptake protein [Haloparvum sedimenti]|uniref:TrkH family potassium uptake protein n=1 Tax=Haloparvum sedimenti TaxID=1678448 RepID=UPI00071E7C37|nr:TrkH family potassium uptake protein [Haloparvum sedimenti]
MPSALKVDWRTSVAVTGTVLKLIAAAMAVPLVVALVYGDDLLVFGASILITLALGSALERFDPDPDLGPREALLLVAVVWIVVAVVGTIPYLLAGYGTESTVGLDFSSLGAFVGGIVNALFESTSGFTTTGATVLGEISTDRHSHALLMWRQLTQWLGGMGIIVLMVAILPELAVNGAQLVSAEAPGPQLQKLTPHIQETARVLWKVYFAFTVALAVLLALLGASGLAPNMDLFNAVAHAFSTMPTGGFSPQSESIAAFSAVVQWAIIPFMVVAGVNFGLFWHLLEGETREFLEDTEFRTYAGLVAALTGVLSVLLFTGVAPRLAIGGLTEGVAENSLRQAAFQIGSLMNSTGFATSDFAQWDQHGQVFLLAVMFVGGSAGSTGGGIKVIRWLIVLKVLKRELLHTSHPDAVQPIRLGGAVVDEEALRGIVAFSMLYLLLFGLGSVVIALDAARVGIELTALEAVGGSLATVGNIGPAFGRLGPFGSYLMLPDTTKLFMIFLMWVGRLEILPVLALFTGAFWRR